MRRPFGKRLGIELARPGRLGRSRLPDDRFRFSTRGGAKPAAALSCGAWRPDSVFSHQPIQLRIGEAANPPTARRKPSQPRSR